MQTPECPVAPTSAFAHGNGSLARHPRASRFRFPRAAGTVLVTSSLLALGLVGCGGGGGGGNNGGGGGGGKAANIGSLKTIATLSSTVDPQNGDQNPYAVGIAPTTFTGDGNPAHLQPGDIVVSNFSNSAGLQWQGTTFEALRNGAPVRVFSEVNTPVSGGGTVTTAGPVAVAFGPNGNWWIANLGPVGDGSQGNVQVASPAGVLAATLTDPKVIGGWGQAFNGGFGGKFAFFTVNIITGEVVRINITSAGFTFDQLTPNLGNAANSIGGTPIGASGMVHASNDTLYVVDGVNNKIFAIPNSTTSGVTSGSVLFSGAPLNQPVGMTVNPINGDLIVANQKDNNLVEISTAGAVVATKTVDPAVVNTTTGANSALFGLAATTDASGNLLVYFADDNDNTVKKLSK